MKKTFLIFLFGLVLTSCEIKEDVNTTDSKKMENRSVSTKLSSTLISGTSYLSVYSQVNSVTSEYTQSLIATISMRNISRQDTLYIVKADYFNTSGKLIRSYFNTPIYIKPLETVEIIIDQKDNEGGTGANFIFDWKVKPTSNDPLFEGVMISTSGQQGLSFTTRGVKVN